MKSIFKRVTALLLAFTVIFTQPAANTREIYAASTAEKTASNDAVWKKLYYDHMRKNHGLKNFNLNGYYVLDIDQNGMPELITAVCSSGKTTYEVYTVRNKEMVKIGKVQSTGSYIPVPLFRYSSKCKALHIYSGYKYCSIYSESLYVISNGELKEHFRASMYPSKIYFKGNNSTNMKEISKSAYDTYMKNYIKTYKAYKMIQNTFANRKKVLVSKVMFGNFRIFNVIKTATCQQADDRSFFMS